MPRYREVELTKEECRKAGLSYGTPNCKHYKLVEIKPKKRKVKPKKKETLREKVKRLEAQVKRLKSKKKVEVHNHYTTSQPLSAEDILAWGKVGGPSGLF